MLAAVCVGSVSVGVGGGDGAKMVVRAIAGLHLSFTPSLNKLQPVSQPGRAGQSTSRASLPVQATKSIQYWPVYAALLYSDSAGPKLEAPPKPSWRHATSPSA